LDDLEQFQHGKLEESKHAQILIKVTIFDIAINQQRPLEKSTK
jgi:hypothetical protein